MTKVVVEIEDVIGQFEDYDAEIRRLKKLYTDAEVKAAAHLNEIERLREALRKCLPVMRRAHDRIHCLPRTSDTELAGEIDITLGIVRSELEEKE